MVNSPEIEREVHLTDYLRVLRKHLWIVMLCPLAAFGFTAWRLSGQESFFRTSARIQIDRESPKILEFQEVVEPERGYYSDEYYQTQYELLRSRSLAQEVINRLNLAKNPEFLRVPKKGQSLGLTDKLKEWLNIGSTPRVRLEKEEKDESGVLRNPSESVLINLFLVMVNINPLKNTSLVDISITSRNARLAADIANALAEVFIQRNKDTRLTTTRQATDWLTVQLEEARKKVEASEMALQRYKEGSDIISPHDRQNIIVQKLEELNTALTKAKTERIALETRYQQLQKLSSTDGTLDTIPEVMGNAMVQQLKKEYNDLQNELSDLSKTYTPKHPRIIRLKSQIESLEERIRTEISNVTKSVRNEYEVAKAREASLAEAVDQQKQITQQLGKKSIQFSVLEREVENNRRIYDLLLQRAKETGLAEGLQTGNIRIVDRAEVPLAPMGPQHSRSMILAFIVGLMAGVGLVFFIEYVDDSIRDPDDIERFVHLPFLAPIPYIRPEKKNTDRELISLKEPKSVSAEAYRSARTGILFSAAAEHRTILVTSSGPQEGKTTTAVNLAVTLAYAGSRVLLMDADLRKPRVHTVFKIANTFGLTNLLAGSNDIKTAMHKTQVNNLCVIPSGPMAVNPSELLSSARMAKLIHALCDIFDRVIIDCPPVIPVTDASIVASSVDGVVMVIRAGRTSRKIILRSKKKLEDVRAKIIGVILNFMDSDKSPHYRQYIPDKYSSYYGRGKKNRSAR